MQYFISKAFMHWLSDNRKRFNHPPCNMRLENHYLMFNLTGITPALVWQLSDYDLMLWVYHQDTQSDESSCWDGLVDFDIFVKQSSNGEYYCDLCEEQYRQYYPTSVDLWQSHCFDNMLNWCNEKITPDKLLVLYGMEDRGCTWAKLISQTEWQTTNPKQEYFYQAIPVQITHGSEIKL